MSSMGESGASAGGSGGGMDYGAMGSMGSSGASGLAGLFAVKDYEKQATLYGQDIQLVKESTALKEYIANHEAYAGMGQTRAAYAASGLKTSGSALDVLGESAKLASFKKSQIALQGQIEENNFLAQQQAAESQASGSLIGGATQAASMAAMAIMMM